MTTNEDGNVVLAPIRLVGITTAKDGSTSPRFHGYYHEENEILFEPYELPAVLRDMLWPREVPAEVVAPVAPVAPVADECDERCAESCPRRQSDTDTDTVPPGSSDYDERKF